MENRIKNDNDIQKYLVIPKDGTGITQQDDTPNEWSKDTVCMTGDSRLVQSVNCFMTEVPITQKPVH